MNSLKLIVLVVLLELRRDVPDQHADDDEHHPEHRLFKVEFTPSLPEP